MAEPMSHTRIGLLFVGGCALVGVLVFGVTHVQFAPDRGNVADMNVVDGTTDLNIAMPEAPATPTDLSGYVGKYPSDASGGTAFLGDPAVRTALAGALGSDKKLGLFTKFAVETPIAADGELLRVHGCEARNCGNGYDIEIARDGTSARVCFQDMGGRGDGKPYWYVDGRLSARSDNCPGTEPSLDAAPSEDSTPDSGLYSPGGNDSAGF